MAEETGGKKQGGHFIVLRLPTLPPTPQNTVTSLTFLPPLPSPPLSDKPAVISHNLRPPFPVLLTLAAVGVVSRPIFLDVSPPSYAHSTLFFFLYEKVTRLFLSLSLSVKTRPQPWRGNNPRQQKQRNKKPEIYKKKNDQRQREQRTQDLPQQKNNNNDNNNNSS